MGKYITAKAVLIKFLFKTLMRNDMRKEMRDEAENCNTYKNHENLRKSKNN